MALYAGIDCGTQGTRVVIVESERGTIVGEGSAPHRLQSGADGAREQHVSDWIDALVTAFHQAASDAAIDTQQITALSVSGQQHGFVALDEAGAVLHPVKLWCDTATDAQNSWLLQQLGGVSGALAQPGIVPATGYTASKILWLKQQHPALWARLHTVLLPHDYLNFWLTGERVMEYGDASGTGLLDIRSRSWDRHTVELIDPDGRLWQALPPLAAAQKCIGTLQPEAAQRLGLRRTVRVATGGGDNMMAAIGSGNIAPGTVTLSLGTSGTLFACSETPVTDENGLIASFCSSTNCWLPLICTMNVTSATTLIQTLLAEDLTGFNQLLNQAEPGAEGVEMLPFFNGERTPALPHAQASLHNLNALNFTRANLCRAAVESATYGLRYGLDLFRQQGISAQEIRLTGGGARSAGWRQIVADVMNCPVVSLRIPETAALGAAIQAMWASALLDNPAQQPDALLQSLCQRFVTPDESTRAVPDAERHQTYETHYQRYLKRLSTTYPEVAL